MIPPATALETVGLFDPASGARVRLSPARGGMVTQFFVGPRPVLFLDEATLLDPGKNVRGGVPVLFPSPGKLQGERWARAGRDGALGQHGFARNLPWAVEAQSESEVTLSLTSTAETLARYPWEFALRYRVRLAGTVLRIEQEFRNAAATPMPFACGFHPYFHVAQRDKAAARIETRATRAFDNARAQEVLLRGPIDLTAAEVDLHLRDHGSSEATLHLGDGARVQVACSPEFRRWVIWTLAGRDFVCLEPWSAPGNALNTGEELLALAPGASTALWTELRFAPAGADLPAFPMPRAP